jgi:hypothetical protein
MKRYHQELPRTRRRHRLLLKWRYGWPKGGVDCVRELQEGRFRKTHALGCRGKCGYCRWRRETKAPSVRDLRAREKARAELDELFERSKE